MYYDHSHQEAQTCEMAVVECEKIIPFVVHCYIAG